MRYTLSSSPFYDYTQHLSDSPKVTELESNREGMKTQGIWLPTTGQCCSLEQTQIKMKTTFGMELISGRTDSDAGAGRSLVLWAEHGVQGVWQNVTGGGTVQQSDPKRFRLGLRSFSRSSRSIERRFRQAIVNRAQATSSGFYSRTRNTTSSTKQRMESSYSYCWDWSHHQKSQYPPPSTVLLLPANDEVWWDIKADHVLGYMALLGQEDLPKFP